MKSFDCYLKSVFMSVQYPLGQYRFDKTNCKTFIHFNIHKYRINRVTLSIFLHTVYKCFNILVLCMEHLKDVDFFAPGLSEFLKLTRYWIPSFMRKQHDFSNVFTTRHSSLFTDIFLTSFFSIWESD